MTSVQLERVQKMLTESQFRLFFRLSKMRDWLGELYLEFILSQEEIELVYYSETNICNQTNKDQDKRSPYLMR
ncbi:hypothetical protein [Pseudanabaena sp. ABRG5-3]|jgi:hypothetical protein|uniref:hypothetical protein n=1 Tax=Pseudanabaena sp. ABRG5-3 TaxID=685565 RepID=UPI000DC72FC9|nr:hypothetical protein [Pseudanabaena sp. ABRG5-3]BBC24638.1 hypothetical protein ABRG53_2381 [Pseudanabaena sp. ABRG5-3]